GRRCDRPRGTAGALGKRQPEREPLASHQAYWNAEQPGRDWHAHPDWKPEQRNDYKRRLCLVEPPRSTLRSGEGGQGGQDRNILAKRQGPGAAGGGREPDLAGARAGGIAK